MTPHRARLALIAAIVVTAGTLVTSLACAQSAKLDDATIIAIFDAANTFDIETGDLASTKGSNAAVREFGAMLSRDHTSVRKQGRDLVAKLGVRPTPPVEFALARGHEAALATLRAARGKAFDRAFLEHEIAYHAAVIDAVTTTLLPALENAEARALVTKVAPAFEAHRLAAKDLLAKQ